MSAVMNAQQPMDWRTVLREQGRTLTWLAKATQRPKRAVFGYSQGSMVPPSGWLDRVEELLGVPVVDRVAEARERARSEVAS